MKTILFVLFNSLLFSNGAWETDFDKARRSAQSEHKLILLNFSGSDWCGPCIRMHTDIFESSSFTQYADEHLVLVNADFPRLKKHALSKDQQLKNDQLAEKYDKDGIFPLTVLLNADGKVLKEWQGLPPISAEAFTAQVKAAVDGSN
jgi:thioredoxin-related protein